jgi:hypothetical protein
MVISKVSVVKYLKVLFQRLFEETEESGNPILGRLACGPIFESETPSNLKAEVPTTVP